MQRQKFMAAMISLETMILDCGVAAEQLKNLDFTGADAIDDNAKNMHSKVTRSMKAFFKANDEEYKLTNYKASVRVRKNKIGGFAVPEGTDKAIESLKITLQEQLRKIIVDATPFVDVLHVVHPSGKRWNKKATDNDRFKDLIIHAENTLKVVS